MDSVDFSADNSANDATDLDDDNGFWGEFRRSALYRYQRPGSRAFSLPSRLGLGNISFAPLTRFVM